jgi:hypothetical protein
MVFVQLARIRAKERFDKMKEDALYPNNTLIIESNGGTKDTFKGFSKEKQREILLENERLKEIKRYIMYYMSEVCNMTNNDDGCVEREMHMKRRLKRIGLENKSNNNVY